MTQKQKENIKHERVLKLKKIGFWTLNIVSYILAGLFLIVLIISLATPKKQNVSPRSAYRLYENEIIEVIREDTPNNVVYEDENNAITFSSDELNNYTWQNLATIETIGAQVYWYSAVVTYGNDEFALDEGDNIDLLYYTYEDYQLYLIYNNTQLNNLNSWIDYDFEIYKFYIIDANEEEVLSFSDTLNLVFEEDYNEFKNAIELDIQANESSETQSIFESLTNVLTNFIITLNSGITSVIALFWNSTTSQLTLLGNLTTIVIGVAVCFFLFRLVIGLIRLRG